MTIGSVLLQPQKIQRAAGQGEVAALAQDLLGLAALVVADPAGYAGALEPLGLAVRAWAGRLGAQAEAGGQTALAHLLAEYRPLLEKAPSLLGPLGSAADAGAAQGAALALLEVGAGAVGSLTAPQISHHVGLLLDALQADLGLTSAYLEGQVRALLDDMIARLVQGLGAAPDPAESERRLAVTSLLRRVRRLLVGLSPGDIIPDFKADHVAQLLLEELQRSGAADILRQVACVGRSVGSAAQAGAAVRHLVSPSSGDNPSDGGNPQRGLQPAFAMTAAPGDPVPAATPHRTLTRDAGSTPAPASAPAGREEYLWYATWLLHDQDSLLFGLDDLNKPQDMVNILKTDDRNVFKDLRDQLHFFDPTTEEALNAYNGGHPPATLLMGLVVFFNHTLEGPWFYNEERFWHVTLAADTLELINQRPPPKGDDQVRFNRMLLEDTFGSALDPLPRSWIKKVGSGILNNSLQKTIWWPGDRVFVDKESKHVMFGDKPLLAGTDVTWTKVPMFDKDAQTEGRIHFNFEVIPASAMEQITYWSALAADAADLAWHLSEIQPSHQISPIWFGMTDLAEGLTSAIARKSLSGLGYTGTSWFLTLLGPIAFITQFTAIQGMHTQAAFGQRFTYWMVKWIIDMMHYANPVATVRKYRNLALSFLTMFNYRPISDWSFADLRTPAFNYKFLDPWADLFGDLFTGLLPVDAKDYGLSGMPAKVLLLGFLAAPAMNVLGAVAACLTAFLVARVWEPGLFADKIVDALTGTIKTWLDFFTGLYNDKEGDTDGGKYNPSGAAFAGYPDKASTVYWLPYPSGKTYFVPQGNQGIVTHNYVANPGLPQVYAYDFALDAGDVILASRPGTVDGFSEGTPDNTRGTWNFIRIRHDADDNGAPIAPDAGHDRDVGGAVVVTYAVYGHGRQNGVTNAFALWNPPAVPAVGMKVKRGQPIMLADHTGNSLFNHLHLHIVPQMPGAVPNSYTIPFVFQDVDGDGVPKAGKWYTSSNPQRTV